MLVVFTRRSLVRAKGEVFVLLYVFFVCSLFLSTISRQPAGRFIRAYSGSGCVFSPFGGLEDPGGGKRGNKIFVTIGVNGEFLHFGGF